MNEKLEQEFAKTAPMLARGIDKVTDIMEQVFLPKGIGKEAQTAISSMKA